jgi:hypothetical protein
MSKSKKTFIIILLLFVAVVVGAAIAKKAGISGVLSGPSKGEASGYQAVFLTNNQVYFGKLVNATTQFPVLRDVYYLQVNTPAGGQLSANDISLVKLGGELHGPIDEMRINRDHILIIEDLKTDSNVVDAIKRFKESQKASEEAAGGQE